MRIWLKFTKEQSLRFLAHLDLLRLWQRAIRRAGLPVQYSQGFNPHPKMSFAAALPVGVTSEAEYLDIHFAAEVTAEEIGRLQRALPPGIRITGWRPVPAQTAALMALVGAQQWRVSLTAEIAAVLPERLKLLLQAGELPVERPGKKVRRTVDIRPYLYRLEMAADQSLELLLAAGSEGGAKPREVLALLEIPEENNLCCTATLLKAGRVLQAPLTVLLREKEVSFNAEETYFQL